MVAYCAKKEEILYPRISIYLIVTLSDGRLIFAEKYGRLPNLLTRGQRDFNLKRNHLSSIYFGKDSISITKIYFNLKPCFSHKEISQFVDIAFWELNELLQVKREWLILSTKNFFIKPREFTHQVFHDTFNTQTLITQIINMTRSQTPLSLEYILLGFLNKSSIHGYDLYKKISNFKGISLVWHIKQSQLYALLEKLEEDGLLRSSLVPGQAHLVRKEFQITPDGRQAFSTWVTCPVSHGREMRQEFLAKLYFAQQSGVEVFTILIEEQTRVCVEWLSNLQDSFAKTTAEQHSERLIFQYRILQTRAMLEWLDHCRAETRAIFSHHSGD